MCCLRAPLADGPLLELRLFVWPGDAHCQTVSSRLYQAGCSARRTAGARRLVCSPVRLGRARDERTKRHEETLVCAVPLCSARTIIRRTQSAAHSLPHTVRRTRSAGYSLLHAVPPAHSSSHLRVSVRANRRAAGLANSFARGSHRPAQPAHSEAAGGQARSLGRPRGRFIGEILSRSVRAARWLPSKSREQAESREQDGLLAVVGRLRREKIKFRRSARADWAESSGRRQCSANNNTADVYLIRPSVRPASSRPDADCVRGQTALRVAQSCRWLAAGPRAGPQSAPSAARGLSFGLANVLDATGNGCHRAPNWGA